MSSGEQKTVVAFPLFTMLTVLFVGLKLVGIIGWSWWWVLAPLWGPVAVMIVFALCAGLVALFVMRR